MNRVNNPIRIATVVITENPKKTVRIEMIIKAIASYSE